jgi:glycosyltransferase involved in cell wall biosynthesis
MHPFFSVIIPLYNKEKYIKKTLQSVVSQSFTNFEIIVIDDGSTEDSLKVVRQFFEINHHITHTIISRENKGLSITRNESINYTNGKYLAFLDADDLWLSSYLGEINAMIKKFSSEKVFATDYAQMYTDGKKLNPKKNIEQQYRNHVFLINDFFKVNYFQPILIPSSLVIEKKLFLSVLFNSELTFSEDIDFFIRLFSNYKLVYSYNTLVYKNENVAQQITQLGLSDKIIPNFNWYEENIRINPSLKRYINHYRYIFASLYKQQGDFDNYKKLRAKIDFEGLNWKQKLLLKLPAFFTNPFIKLKKILLKKGIRITTY